MLGIQRKAVGSTPGGRLVQAVPDAEALLDAAFVQGESAGRQTAQLVNLLDLYGASELRAAVREALERKTPRASSVAFILSKRSRSRRQPFRATVALAHRPELNDLTVTPHNLENYDDLADKH
jgi:phosphoglycerate-specific signal transduction histidine kinase